MVYFIVHFTTDKHQTSRNMNVNDNEKDTKVGKEIPTDVVKWASERIRVTHGASNTDALEAIYDDMAERYDEVHGVATRVNGHISP